MPASFIIPAIAPFRLDLTVWTLRRRADNLVDGWDGETYCRVLPWRHEAVEIAVRQLRGHHPRIEITAAGWRLTNELRNELSAAVHRLLGPRTNLAAFYRFAASEPKLGQHMLLDGLAEKGLLH